MDLERFRLRRFLESLPPQELDRREEPIELGDVAAAHEGNSKAVWFVRAGGAEAAHELGVQVLLVERSHEALAARDIKVSESVF